jgi:hypothetical protein
MEPETRSSPLNESDSHSSEDAIKKRSPKEKFQNKRSSEKDRFRTRTLADLDLTNMKVPHQRAQTVIPVMVMSQILELLQLELLNLQK